MYYETFRFAAGFPPCSRQWLCHRPGESVSNTMGCIRGVEVGRFFACVKAAQVG